MLALACAHVSSAQAPRPGLQAARYRLVSQGEPAPYTGILLDKPTYDMETAKFDALAAAIKERDATINNMAKDTTAYGGQLRELRGMYNGQVVLTKSAQAALGTTQASLVVTQKAAAVLAPRWYERPLTIGPLCFAVGVAATVYAISKF
jgi:hypothetical protein